MGNAPVRFVSTGRFSSGWLAGCWPLWLGLDADKNGQDAIFGVGTVSAGLAATASFAFGGFGAGGFDGIVSRGEFSFIVDTHDEERIADELARAGVKCCKINTKRGVTSGDWFERELNWGQPACFLITQSTKSGNTRAVPMFPCSHVPEGTSLDKLRDI